MVHDLAKLLIKEVGCDANLGDILHTERPRVGLGMGQPTVKTAAD